MPGHGVGDRDEVTVGQEVEQGRAGHDQVVVRLSRQPCEHGADVRDPGSGEPDPGRTASVIAHARDVGKVLFMNAGTWGNVIRFMPPLVVDEDEVDAALAALSAALDATR